VVAGLTIWTLILTPDPPRPGPGAGRAATAAPPAGAGTPAATPPKPIVLPEEVKTFIANLATKAKEAPKDVEVWNRFAQVNFRAGQLDPTYFKESLAAYRHVLEIDPKNADALRGIANVHYERDEHKEAIVAFERYLAQRPDDPAARTDLGTMYLSAGDPARALATYREVLDKNPDFLQAHYNLAVAYHRQGKKTEALAELNIARTLATDEAVRGQIDEMIVALQGQAPGAGTATGTAAAPPAGKPQPFQAAVEEAFRGSPIMGPRIVRFEWSGPAAGRVMVANFPMEGMPPAVREKFAARLAQELKTAQTTHHVEGPVRMEIADAGSGKIMATVTP
jgi:tetratricopeptide (TPR) repeat protein